LFVKGTVEVVTYLPVLKVIRDLAGLHFSKMALFWFIMLDCDV